MILEYLKEHTTEIHRKVEQGNLAQYIIDHSISKGDYEKLLIQNLTFYHSIDQAVKVDTSYFNSGFSSYTGEEKVAAIENDLRNLGSSFNRSSAKDFGFKVQSKSAAIGAMYVSEGSAMGGMVIGKHLGACTQLSTLETHHFFGGDVPSIMSRWKGFRQTVVEHESETINKDEALKAAIDSFELFGRIMKD